MNAPATAFAFTSAVAASSAATAAAITLVPAAKQKIDRIKADRKQFDTKFFGII